MAGIVEIFRNAEMKATDIFYKDEGLFTSFIPESDAGISLWKQLAEHTDGTGKVFTIHAESTIKQMRDAGYTVRKHKPMSKKETDQIYSELDSLFLY